MESEIRTRTYHVVDWKNEEIGKVMAVTEPKDAENLTFKTQFSFLCPKDAFAKKFNRKKGKDIAIWRLNSFRAIEFNKDKNVTMSNILKGLIISEAKRKNIQWMENLTEMNLK